MTEEPYEEQYLDLFKPKPETSGERAPQPPEPDAAEIGRASGIESDRPARGDTVSPRPGPADPPAARVEPADPIAGIGREAWFASPFLPVSERARTLRTVGVVAGGGCLLLALLAVVVFAFIQVFGRGDGGDEPQDTPLPTESAAFTPAPTAPVAQPPILVPVVESSGVRVPIALPERLTVGQTIFTVQAVEAPLGAWPSAPTAGDTAHWIYGTVVNYILGLAPTSENVDLLSALRVDETISLHMSTGLVLNFNVTEITIGTTDQGTVFEQISPRLTLALLSDDPAQRTVITAAFFSDEAGETGLFSEAVIGLVGKPVDQGPVRVTVIEAYQVGAGEAGLPPGTGFLLIDLRVENLGTRVLEPEFFQTFVSDATGGRYPLTLLAEQFSHYGIPAQPLAPGETVIGSVGYLVPGSAVGQVEWVFNPLPGSDYWVVVPLNFELPLPPPTAESPPPIGFARVTVDTNDVFINREDGLLDIGLRIENLSEGVVLVTEADISLSSFTDGELPLRASAPMLPWTVEPRELRLFQLQFEMPTADSALLDVLDYTFSIENLGGG